MCGLVSKTFSGELVGCWAGKWKSSANMVNEHKYSKKRKNWCQVNKLTQKQNEEGLLKVLEKNAVNQEMICTFKLGCKMHIFNSYSLRTHRI